MLPAPNVRMRNSRRSTTTTLPACTRRSSSRTKAAIDTRPTTAATVTIEIELNGHSHPPAENGASGTIQP